MPVTIVPTISKKKSRKYRGSHQTFVAIMENSKINTKEMKCVEDEKKFIEKISYPV